MNAKTIKKPLWKRTFQKVMKMVSSWTAQVSRWGLEAQKGLCLVHTPADLQSDSSNHEQFFLLVGDELGGEAFHGSHLIQHLQDSCSPAWREGGELEDSASCELHSVWLQFWCKCYLIRNSFALHYIWLPWQLKSPFNYQHSDKRQNELSQSQLGLN